MKSKMNVTMKSNWNVTGLMALLFTFAFAFQPSFAQFYITLEPTQSHYNGLQVEFDPYFTYPTSNYPLNYFYTSPSCNFIREFSVEGSCFFNKVSAAAPSKGYYSGYFVEFCIGNYNAANPLRNDSGEMKISFVPNPDSADGRWKIYAVEFESFNIEGIPNLKMNVNGHEVAFSDKVDWNWIRVDFNEEEQWMDSLTMSAEYGKPAAFAKIRLYTVPNIKIADEPFPTYLDYGKDNYFFPLPPLRGTVWEDPQQIGLSILDEDSQVVAVGYPDRYDAKQDGFQIPESFNGDNKYPIMEVGRYYACYYLTEEYYNIAGDPDKMPTLKASEGIPFTCQPVLPSEAGLNWSKIQGSIAYVPTAVDGSTRTWSNAILTGTDAYLDEIYWKIAKEADADNINSDNRPLFRNSNSAEVVAYAVAEDHIPEGYTRYEASGIDLRGGDTLYLILEKNGILSQPVRLEYREFDATVGIQSIIDINSQYPDSQYQDSQNSPNSGAGNAARSPQPQYFNLDGIPTTLSPSTSNSRSMILIERLPDGKSRLIIVSK